MPCYNSPTTVDVQCLTWNGVRRGMGSSIKLLKLLEIYPNQLHHDSRSNLTPNDNTKLSNGSKEVQRQVDIGLALTKSWRKLRTDQYAYNHGYHG